MLTAASLTALNCKQPDFHCGIIMQLNCYLVTKLCLTLLRFPWTVAHQAPLSIGFSKQEYWSGLPFLPPGDLPNPGVKPTSPALDSLPLSHLGRTELSEQATKCWHFLMHWVVRGKTWIIIYSSSSLSLFSLRKAKEHLHIRLSRCKGYHRIQVQLPICTALYWFYSFFFRKCQKLFLITSIAFHRFY